METIEVRIESGRIRGEAIDGIGRFLGVPYAAAPMAERRFAAPEPPPPWEGIRDATTPVHVRATVAVAGPRCDFDARTRPTGI
jgi:carboxylesterase type B